jgi:hypothetical protein
MPQHKSNHHVAVIVCGRTLVFISLLLAALGAGCSSEDSPHEPPETSDSSMIRRDLTSDEVLIRAKSEMIKVGLRPPEGVAEQSLREMGVVPKVTVAENGWRVDYPLGHAWAYGWAHLDLDSSGRLLHHEVVPGK